MHSFSTHRAPLAQRASLFRQQMQDRFSVGLAIESSDGAPLTTQLSGYSGRSLRFASLRLSPHRTSAAPARDRQCSRLLVTLQDEGIAAISQDGRQTSVTPGEFCLVDPGLPFTIETTQIRTRSLYLDRASLLSALPQLGALTARSISGTDGSGTLFRSMLDQIFQLAPSLDEDTADAIADAIPYVLATALQSLKRELVPRDSRLKLFHRQRIMRFARGSLRDPRLDTKSIAHGVNLSPRYICDIFSAEPKSLMKWVWSERLEHCRRDLEDPALRQRTISEIAYGWGFSELAHFSRSFRLQFGRSPRDWRRDPATAAVPRPAARDGCPPRN